MNPKRNYFPFLGGIVVLMTLGGCTAKDPEIKWDYSDKEVVGPPPQKTARIDLDVYLDATSSMEGFAVNDASIYSQFLDQLEASALSAWKNTDARYYKFGESIRPVSRTEFLSAKNNPAFYHEKGIFTKTYIDSVVKRTDTSRLSVLVTDLFQDEGDVNAMVEKLKQKCFANGITVGIIGIRSAFDGKVFDVQGFPSGYTLKSSERPLYAIVFGNLYNTELLFESLKSKPFIKEEQFLIISRYINRSFNVSLSKTRDATSLTNKKSLNPHSFNFIMREGKDGRLNLLVKLDRNTRCADFSAPNLKIVAYKKSVTDPKNKVIDSVLTNDISIESIRRSGDSLTAVLTLKNNGTKGYYSYEVLLKPDELNGLVAPAWVKDFSTDRPVPGTPSASKTYNFDKLCSTLLVANAAISPSYIAKFYINISKR
ncbi:hypothetical protein [uncultured Chitinophaga sp.]|jgi:hypothetical protein|uniref:hypothetical protein n=1 Tax=uncultured Chitinophaga sp. TaxID=339340 RepID=UPI002632A9B2|nr:hypothetical protein [uncultured Chitinophaga sp.]